MTTDSTATPGALRWAVWLLRGEAVALGLLAVYLVYEDLAGTATDLVSGLFVTGFTVLGAVVLWTLAMALWRRRAGARGPAVVLQLMLLPVGYYMIQGGLAWLGGPLIALGLLVAILLFSTSTARALGMG